MEDRNRIGVILSNDAKANLKTACKALKVRQSDLVNALLTTLFDLDVLKANAEAIKAANSETHPEKVKRVARALRSLSAEELDKLMKGIPDAA